MDLHKKCFLVLFWLLALVLQPKHGWKPHWEKQYGGERQPPGGGRCLRRRRDTAESSKSYHVVYRVTAATSNKSRAGFTEKKRQQAKCVKVLTTSPVLFRAHNTPHIPHTRNWTDRERRKRLRQYLYFQPIYATFCTFARSDDVSLWTDCVCAPVLFFPHHCISFFSALNRRVEHF